MGVIWDTGFEPAYAHEGAPVTVLTDGRVLVSHRDDTGATEVGSVAGWRAGCECGWVGTQLFARSEFDPEPAKGNVSLDGIAPDEVDELCAAEWEVHLHQAMPLLSVHDAARKLAELTPVYEAARCELPN